MIKFLKSLFKSEGKPSENQEFIRLIQVMRDDDAFRNFILKIVEQEETTRVAILDKKIDELKSKRVSQDHIDIFTFLKSQSICNKIKEISKHKN